MLHLPKSTEVKKAIPKKTIYQKFSTELVGAKKRQFDQDISRLTITNEISENTLNLQRTEELAAIFVVRVDLKTKDYSDSNIVLLSKLIGQRILMVLVFQNESRLAIYETRLIVSDWYQDEIGHIKITGLNLKSVWDNLVSQVGAFQIEEGNTLEEQLEKEKRKEWLEKQIAIYERKLRKEVQSKKKYELFSLKKDFEEELEKLGS